MEHAQRDMESRFYRVPVVVLILILMEHAQRAAPLGAELFSACGVLILILMEHAQRDNHD